MKRADCELAHLLEDTIAKQEKLVSGGKIIKEKDELISKQNVEIKALRDLLNSHVAEPSRISL